MAVDAPPAGTTEASVRAAAMGFGHLLGRLTGLGPQAEAVFDQATLAFTDLLTPPIRAQATEHLAQLESVVAASVYAESVLDGWADDVAWYVAQVQALDAEWESVADGSFGVPAPELSAAMPPEQQHQALAGYDAQVAEARQEHLTTLNHQAQMAYADYLARAQERARQLTQGATEANVAALVAHGDLGWVAPVLWDHAPLPRLTAADGTDHAEHLLALLSDPTLGPDPAALATVDIVRWILDRAAADPASVTPARLDYLAAFYATLGGQVVDLDALLERPQSSDGYVIQHVGGTPVVSEATLAGDGPALDPAARTAALAALANGIMLLSSEKYGGSLARIPAQLVAMLKDVPSRVQHNGLAKGTLTTVYPGQSDAATSFLAHSSLPPGLGLSKQLTVAAANYLSALKGGALGLGADDSTAKELLWLIGRNPVAAHAAITGQDLPESFDATKFLLDVHTHTWSDDGVAAAKLTEWIPAYKGSTDTERVEAADAAMHALVTTLTETGPEDTAPFTLMLDAARDNPKATQSLGAATAAFLTEVGNANADTGASRSDYQQLFTLLARDDDTMRALSIATSAFADHNLNCQVATSPSKAGAQNGQLAAMVSIGVLNSALQDQLAAQEASARLSNLLSLGGALTPVLPGPASTTTTMVFLAALDGTLPVTQPDPVPPSEVIADGRDPDGNPIYVRPNPQEGTVEQKVTAAYTYLAAAIPTGLVPADALPPALLDENGQLRPFSEVDPDRYTDLYDALLSAAGAPAWQALVDDYATGYADSLDQVDAAADDLWEWRQLRDVDEDGER